jgi:hypothetical protein
MTESPDYPGFETRTDKRDVAGAQAALDATFNAHGRSPLEDVEGRLREELRNAGVGDDLSDAWVARMADHIRAGEPVIAEVDES